MAIHYLQMSIIFCLGTVKVLPPYQCHMRQLQVTTSPECTLQRTAKVFVAELKIPAKIKNHPYESDAP